MNWLFFESRFLGIEWHTWKIIGWVGNLAFFSRFFVQWYASEKQKRVVIPVAFWWLSLAGSLLLLGYAIFHRRDSVFIFAYAFTWLPYIRNLVLHFREKRGQLHCPACGCDAGGKANFCSQCGSKLGAGEANLAVPK